jgi:hypothetical protein
VTDVSDGQLEKRVDEGKQIVVNLLRENAQAWISISFE